MKGRSDLCGPLVNGGGYCLIVVLYRLFTFPLQNIFISRERNLFCKLEPAVFSSLSHVVCKNVHEIYLLVSCYTFYVLAVYDML